MLNDVVALELNALIQVTHSVLVRDTGDKMYKTVQKQ